MRHSQGFLHQLGHDFGVFEVEAFARVHVQLQGDGIQLLPAISGQVRALGHAPVRQREATGR